MKRFLLLLSLIVLTLTSGINSAYAQTSVWAKNDFFSTSPINSFTGGTTASVLANDTVNLVPNSATTANVTVSWLTTAPAGVTLNSNGTITVSSGAALHGAYLFNYRICGQINTGVCSEAYATIYVDTDSDGDGVSDLYDLDDDNDGILDGNPFVYGEANECNEDLVTAYSTFANNVQTLASSEIGNPAFTSSPAYFIRIRPSDFNFGVTVPSLPRTAGELNTVKLTGTADYSAFYGLPTGSVVVAIENANVHPSADEFYIQNALGASNVTRIRVYGTVGCFIGAEHGREYYRRQTRAITFLDGATDFGGPTPTAGLLNVGTQPTVSGQWTATVNGQYYSLKREGSSGGIDTAHTGFHYANLNPGMTKYVEFSTDNAEPTEYSTFFFRLFPECDTDKDGIPNRLDLDSDNDGCLDALEGGSTFTYAQLVASGGTLSVGMGSAALNRNLCGDGTCVDANGIPDLSPGGQTYVGTYNATLLSSVCLLALPVSLSDFDASKNQHTVLLNWVTNGEQNNKGFALERSADGRNWTNIGFVNSKAPAGNSSLDLSYSYTDLVPLKGINYYRLRQTDVDGRYKVSDVVKVSFEGNAKGITVFPNPVKDNVTISGLEGNETIHIFDVTGRRVKQLKSAGAAITVDLSNLSEGVYHIQLISEKGVTVLNKIVKTR